MPATLILVFNFERAWQAQFLSHTHKIFKKCIFFYNEKMMLLPYFCNVPQNPVILEKLDFLLEISTHSGKILLKWAGFSKTKLVFLGLKISSK